VGQILGFCSVHSLPPSGSRLHRTINDVIGTKNGVPCKNLHVGNTRLEAPVFEVERCEIDSPGIAEENFHAIKSFA
jgi:hypothetical protein